MAGAMTILPAEDAVVAIASTTGIAINAPSEPALDVVVVDEAVATVVVVTTAPVVDVATPESVTITSVGGSASIPPS